MAQKAYRLRCSLVGHSMDVRAVAAAHSSDGAVATGSRDRTTRLWIPNEIGPGYFESQCLTGPTNFVASVCAVSPSDQHPSGLILVGSNDCCIYCFSPESPQPLYKLLGHSGVVCALAAGQFGTLLSGSWDRTARVWFGQKCMLTLEGHQGPVWAVQILPKQGLMLTGSADKTVRLWRAGKCERVFTGHEDCVRGLAILSNMEFLSCSNDCTIRHWAATGDCLHVYTAHTNFVYSVSVLPDSVDEFVSCGEDRTVRVWSHGECVQTIRLPAQSIWSVACLANGDIVVGSSDGVARVFTRHPNLYASAQEQRELEEEVSKSALPAQEIGDIKINELPGKEALQERGKRDGQTILVRDGGVVSAYQWVAVDNEWQKIGDVVGTPNADTPAGKVTFEGKEYDYVFDVDLDDGSKMKLPYNLSEDPWFAAQAFIHRHNLSQYYLDQVANFIMQNTKGMVMETTAPSVSDPFTGGSRYIPGTAPRPGTAPDVAASVAQRPSMENDAAAGDTTVGGHFFPQTNFLRFDVANTQGILSKLREFNGQVPLEDTLTDDALTRLMMLATASCSPDDEQMAALEKVIHWPHEFVFPALDLLRLALRGPDVSRRVCELGGSQLCSHLLAILSAAGSSPANQMLSLRSLCNLFSQPSGEALALQERTRVLTTAQRRAAAGSTANKNTQIALATLLLNYAVAFCRASRCEETLEGMMQLLTVLATAASEFTDGEAQFRLLVAIGTLCDTDEEVRDLSRALELPEKLQKLSGVQEPGKVARCTSQVLALLQ
ncbi:phospholipase A-2-activating protein-like [Ornithodoros turicata]|uniref:Putative phospholipase a2-activating protein n=1 Tax=Ornithodoros turicata TaxID=34597 RepID=A0A2R5LAN6_9ACAR